MREDGDRPGERRLGKGRRVGAVAQAAAAVATTVTQRGMLSRLPCLIRMRGYTRAIEARPVVGTVLRHGGTAHL